MILNIGQLILSDTQHSRIADLLPDKPNDKVRFFPLQDIEHPIDLPIDRLFLTCPYTNLNGIRLRELI